MEALDRVSHGSALISQPSHSPHNRSTTARVETDAGRVESGSASHGVSDDRLSSHCRSGPPTGVRSRWRLRRSTGIGGMDTDHDATARAARSTPASFTVIKDSTPSSERGGAQQARWSLPIQIIRTQGGARVCSTLRRRMKPLPCIQCLRLPPPPVAKGL